MTTYDTARTVVKGLEKRDTLAYTALAYAILGDTKRAEAFRMYARELYNARGAELKAGVC